MYFYFIIFAMDRFENLQVKKEEQKRDPRIIKIIKTNNINGLEMEFNSLFLRQYNLKLSHNPLKCMF